MDETTRPRHIRDIAHLYVSRLRNEKTSRRDTVLISGENRECFPGIHVANLAAAIAIKAINTSKKVRVSVWELSGLLPNAGYYLALPPESYLGSFGREAFTPHCALFDIKVSLLLHKTQDDTNEAGITAVDVVHMPPVESEDEFRQALGLIQRIPGGGKVFVHIGNEKNSHSLLMNLLSGHWKMMPVYALFLGEKRPGDISAGSKLTSLGWIGGWQQALKNRIPAVLRVPQSELARSYNSACESLLYQVRISRRTTNAITSKRFSSGIEAG